MRGRHPVPLAARFHTKYLVDAETGCWLWTANKSAKGYGQISYGKGHLRAHRVSYELHNGKIPRGLWVLHSCDTPACVNPDHLRVGTVADNVRDAMERGQWKPPPNFYGEEVSYAKLTEDAVRHIRRKELTRPAYAELYRVHVGTINKILRGERWARVKS